MTNRSCHIGTYCILTCMLFKSLWTHSNIYGHRLFKSVENILLIIFVCRKGKMNMFKVTCFSINYESALYRKWCSVSFSELFFCNCKMLNWMAFLVNHFIIFHVPMAWNTVESDVHWSDGVTTHLSV